MSTLYGYRSINQSSEYPVHFKSDRWLVGCCIFLVVSPDPQSTSDFLPYYTLYLAQNLSHRKTILCYANIQVCIAAELVCMRSKRIVFRWDRSTDGFLLCLFILPNIQPSEVGRITPTMHNIFREVGS
jgi:hypothetical protein